MKNEVATTLLALVAMILVPLASASPRTFVASTGVDTNPCSIAQPCRSFATAVSNTAINGEVVVLDSAGYGAVTISAPVRITAPPGVYAGITAPAGADGITVAHSFGVTALRGLTLSGSGFNGIHVLMSTAAMIDDCTFDGLALSGIRLEVNSRALIRNSRFANNGTAITVFEAADVAIDGISVFGSTDSPGGGVDVVATHDGVVVSVGVSNSTFASVANAIRAFNGGNGLVKVAVINDMMQPVGTGIFGADNGPGHVVITASENLISAVTGIHVDGANVTLIASGNRITAGVVGIESPALDSTVITLQNNTIEGNGVDVGVPLVTRSLK